MNDFVDKAVLKAKDLIDDLAPKAKDLLDDLGPKAKIAADKAKVTAHEFSVRAEGVLDKAQAKLPDDMRSKVATIRERIGV
jgi:polyhydroxyalkanoate synthesis regulator phasin